MVRLTWAHVRVCVGVLRTAIDASGSVLPPHAPAPQDRGRDCGPEFFSDLRNTNDYLLSTEKTFRLGLFV